MTTLPLFWHLSSASKKERIDASVKLVGSLEQFQAKFVPEGSGDDSGSEEERDDKSNALDQLNSQDVSYSIKRLIRGLASPRESSRLGFAVALTELLSRLDSVTSVQILQLILVNSKQQGSMSGQEERDVLFARLFGILAVVQSGLAFRRKPLPTSDIPASSLESFLQLIKELANIGEERSWLRESAWFALDLTSDALRESEVSWKDQAVDQTLDILFVDNKVWSTEKIATTLKWQDFYPNRDWKKYVAPTFKTPDLLSSGNLAIVAKVLKESTTDEDGVKDLAKAPPGAWKPQLNFAWHLILDQVLPGPNSKKPGKGSFQDFYRVVVDEGLFSSTSSPQRKYWGFQVFQKALTRVDEDSMPMLFTRNFMRSWINHLSNKDRYLHKIAQQTATAVQAFVKDKPQLGFALIIQLTGIHGSQQFDRLTKTKTVESIISTLDVSGVQNYVDHLLAQTDATEDSGSDVTTINSRRAWMIEQMGALTRNGKIPKDDGWVTSVLSWLTIHGLFSIKKKSSKSPFKPLHTVPSPIFSDELRKSCRERLLSCLSDLSQATVAQPGDKASKAVGVAADEEMWISKVLSIINTLEQDTKHVVLIVEFDEDELALLNKAKEAVTTLKAVTGDRKEAAQGAELLILGTTLQHYCSADDQEALDQEALESCIESSMQLFKEPLKIKSKGRGRDSTAEADQPGYEPIDVLVDTLIGYLEKSTAYMRTVSNQVFGLLAGSVKETTIDLIVTQLEHRDPTHEEEDEDVEMEDDKSSEDGDEDDADEESEDENEGGSDDEGDDDEADYEEAQELRKKIEEALRVNGIEPATGDTDSEDEEELMDDDQMMAIDEQLAQVFRSRTNEKKGKDVDAQRQATHFKNRVLDFVDTYIKKQPSNPLVLRLINTLINVSTSGPDEQQLADKAKGIIRSRFGKVKEVPTNLTTDDILPIAQNLHEQARRARSADFLNLLALLNTYQAKIFIHLNAESTLINLYEESLKDFASRKNSGLNPHFFQDFVRRFPGPSWSLRKAVLDSAEEAINSYRQVQILQLAETMVNLFLGLGNKEKDVLSFMPDLKSAVLKAAVGACSESSNMTSAQMKDLFKVALAGVRHTRRLSPSTTELTWDPASWESLRDSLASSRLKAATGLQKMCDNIIKASKAPISKQAKEKKKRKAGEVNGDEGVSKDDPKKHKRKKLKQAPSSS